MEQWTFKIDYLGYDNAVVDQDGHIIVGHLPFFRGVLIAAVPKLLEALRQIEADPVGAQGVATGVLWQMRRDFRRIKRARAESLERQRLQFESLRAEANSNGAIFPEGGVKDKPHRQ